MIASRSDQDNERFMPEQTARSPVNYVSLDSSKDLYTTPYHLSRELALTVIDTENDLAVGRPQAEKHLLDTPENTCNVRKKHLGMECRCMSVASKVEGLAIR